MKQGAFSTKIGGGHSLVQEEHGKMGNCYETTHGRKKLGGLTALVNNCMR